MNKRYRKLPSIYICKLGTHFFNNSREHKCLPKKLLLNYINNEKTYVLMLEKLVYVRVIEFKTHEKKEGKGNKKKRKKNLFGIFRKL